MLHLETDAWSKVKWLRQEPNKYPSNLLPFLSVPPIVAGFTHRTTSGTSDAVCHHPPGDCHIGTVSRENNRPSPDGSAHEIPAKDVELRALVRIWSIRVQGNGNAPGGGQSSSYGHDICVSLNTIGRQAAYKPRSYIDYSKYPYLNLVCAFNRLTGEATIS